ncbi:MAG: hypothetical protein QM813_26365 [Verrucomicrobiota bacterium]
MKEGNVKVWHLILTVAVQLVIGGIWAGQMGSAVQAHEKRLSAAESDVKRMDNDGPAVWRNSLRFSDKEAEQVKRDLEAMRAEMQSQRQILVRIEAQLRQ